MKTSFKYGVTILVMGLLSVGLTGQVRVKLDLKTRFSEKFDLKGVKYGTMHQLEEDGFEIVEFGEEYCIWLKDYSEEKTGKNDFKYKLRISLTPPTTASEKTSALRAGGYGQVRGGHGDLLER